MSNAMQLGTMRASALLSVSRGARGFGRALSSSSSSSPSSKSSSFSSASALTPSAPRLHAAPAFLAAQLVRRASTSASVASANQTARSSSSPAPSVSTSTSTSTPSASASAALVPTAPVLARAAANPPSTTRPPPLVLPERGPQTSTFGHLLATGKAYLAFYKTGLRYLFANTKRVRQIAASSAAGSTTRADLLLRHRWRHDMRRLPVFGLLLLVCGEFTPFVVLVFPHVVPYPCRIPKQVRALRDADEKRRRAAFAVAQPAPSAAAAQNLLIARSLNLHPLWHRLGLLAAAPGLARATVDRRLRFLAEDDALLRQAGGAPALEPDEVVLACADRGMDVLDKDEARLRAQLASWLALTRPPPPQPGVEAEDARQQHVHGQMVTLLTRRPEAWPER